MLDDQLTPTPMVINVDNNEYAAKTSATEFKGEERTSIKTKRANSLNESVGDNERSNSKIQHDKLKYHCCYWRFSAEFNW